MSWLLIQESSYQFSKVIAIGFAPNREQNHPTEGYSPKSGWSWACGGPGGYSPKSGLSQSSS
jgi:hypothetical protein